MRRCICVNCSSKNLIESKFCINCGFQLDKFICYNCKNIVSIENEKCPSCDKELRKTFLIPEILTKEEIDDPKYSFVDTIKMGTIVCETRPNLTKILTKTKVEKFYQSIGYLYDIMETKDKRVPILLFSKETKLQPIVEIGKYKDLTYKLILVQKLLRFTKQMFNLKVDYVAQSNLFIDDEDKILPLHLEEKEIKEEEAIKRLVKIYEELGLKENKEFAELFNDVETGNINTFYHIEQRLDKIIESIVYFKLDYYGYSNVGKVRSNNEDNFFAAIINSCGYNKEGYKIRINGGLFLLCDGMGGHQKGEIASYETINTIKVSLLPMITEYKNESEIKLAISNAIYLANEKLFELNKHYKDIRERMGTTLVGLLILNNKGYIFHIGDSRCYLYKEQKLIRMTEDHNVAFREAKLGNMTLEEAMKLPDAKQLTQAIGPKSNEFLHPVIQSINLTNDSIFILCSDGLTDCVEDKEIQGVLAKESSLQEKCQELIVLANTKGGQDNITILLIKLK